VLLYTLTHNTSLVAFWGWAQIFEMTPTSNGGGFNCVFEKKTRVISESTSENTTTFQISLKSVKYFLLLSRLPGEEGDEGKNRVENI